MKPKVFFILLCAAFSLQGCAGTGTIRSIRASGGVTEEEVVEEMTLVRKFPTRIRLVYLMAWNGIPVGRIIAESGDIMKYRGRDVYVLTLKTESNKFLSKIYRIEDTYTSYIDAGSMTSMRYEADRKEGNYRKHVIVEYDFDRMEAVYTNLTDGSVKRCSIEKNVQDPVSAMCYFMTLPLRPGDRIKMTVNLNEKNYRLFGLIDKLDVIKLPRLGSFAAFKVVPYAELKGERVKKGRGWMYFEADKRRYPLYGVVRIPFGRVTSTLRSMERI